MHIDVFVANHPACSVGQRAEKCGRGSGFDPRRLGIDDVHPAIEIIGVDVLLDGPIGHAARLGDVHLRAIKLIARLR